jgi:PPOX class probable F420-dependent enzyme
MSASLPDAVRAFLDAPRFAVVATINADGAPQQSVVWYAVRGDRILFNTKRGRLKDRNMRRDARVSFCVEDEYRWVAIRGTVEIVDNPEVAKPDMLEITRLYLSEEESQHEYEVQYSREPRASVWLTIESVASYGFDGA